MPRVKQLHAVVRFVGTDYIINDLGPSKSPRFELYNEKTKTVVQKSNNPLTFDKYTAENVYVESIQEKPRKGKNLKLNQI